MNRLIVEPGQELGYDQADERAIGKIRGRPIRHGSIQDGNLSNWSIGVYTNCMVGIGMARLFCGFDVGSFSG